MTGKQLKIRGQTYQRLCFVKPYTNESMQEMASNFIDKGLQTLVARKGIPLPADCAFPPVIKSSNHKADRVSTPKMALKQFNVAMQRAEEIKEQV